MKRYDKWNEVKKSINNKRDIITFKERDVFWASIGENIGYEQNGKGDDFSRPIIVIKKLSRNMFFGIPLSTKIKDGSYFHEFTFLQKQSNALIVQGRLFDIKRLENRMGMITKEDFEKIKDKLKKLLDL